MRKSFVLRKHVKTGRKSGGLYSHFIRTRFCIKVQWNQFCSLYSLNSLVCVREKRDSQSLPVREILKMYRECELSELSESSLDGAAA